MQDLTGQTFGRLTVTGKYPLSLNGRRANWICRCVCGAEVILRDRALISGNTRSCGCLARDLRADRHRTHGRSKTREYGRWNSMVQRCINPQVASYPRYGGRGITVCDRWRTFENFLADMGPIPSPEYQIDRIDNQGDYSPENCRWADRRTQMNNKGCTCWIEWRGERKPLTNWADVTGIPACEIHRRLKRGWSVDRALTQPLRTRNVRPDSASA